MSNPVGRSILSLVVWFIPYLRQIYDGTTMFRKHGFVSTHAGGINLELTTHAVPCPLPEPIYGIMISAFVLFQHHELSYLCSPLSPFKTSLQNCGVGSRSLSTHNSNSPNSHGESSNLTWAKLDVKVPRFLLLGKGTTDKDHSVSIGPIIRSKANKIQQAFILHLQNWIGSVRPSFHVLQANSIEEIPFETSDVNICIVEVADEVASIIS